MYVDICGKLKNQNTRLNCSKNISSVFEKIILKNICYFIVQVEKFNSRGITKGVFVRNFKLWRLKIRSEASPKIEWRLLYIEGIGSTDPNDGKSSDTEQTVPTVPNSSVLAPEKVIQKASQEKSIDNPCAGESISPWNNELTNAMSDSEFEALVQPSFATDRIKEPDDNAAFNDLIDGMSDSDLEALLQSSFVPDRIKEQSDIEEIFQKIQESQQREPLCLTMPFLYEGLFIRGISFQWLYEVYRLFSQLNISMYEDVMTLTNIDNRPAMFVKYVSNPENIGHEICVFMLKIEPDIFYYYVKKFNLKTAHLFTVRS